MRKIILKHPLCPGDVLVLTAAIECLVSQHPGQFTIGVQTNHNALFENNPHVEKCYALTYKNYPPDVEVIDCHYNLIHRSGQEPIHFMGAFVEDLSEKLNVKIRLDRNRPALYLSPPERVRHEGFPQAYALINCGTKRDYTCKGFGQHVAQEIVDAYRDILTFVQVGQKKDMHKPLKGVVNWIGKTTHRELVSMAYHSVLGVGGVSFLHHIYGAIEKPFVCYVGGREQVSWVQYPTATMLSTIGQLNCCKSNGCWKSRVVPLNDGDEKDRSLCTLPMLQPDKQAVPACMALLGSEPAISAIDRMISYGVIPIKV